MKPVIVGSRGSALALAQSRLVMADLQKAWPERTFELRIIKTQGDRLSEDPARVAGEPLSKGLFTAELERALLSGDIDLAVHSLKDLPTSDTPGLILGAIPQRADARDLLITRGPTTLGALPPDALIATGSPRRAAQLRLVQPGFQVTPVRGNIDTRLRKFRENLDWHALLLAAAGIARLGLETGELTVAPISFAEMLPAPGQGALALQISASSPEMKDIVQVIHDSTTAAEIAAERSFLQALGGGCQQPIAALAITRDGELLLQGIAWLNDEPKARRGTLRGPIADPITLGKKLAEDIS